jgi:hypothetical protein
MRLSMILIAAKSGWRACRIADRRAHNDEPSHHGNVKPGQRPVAVSWQQDGGSRAIEGQSTRHPRLRHRTALRALSA